MNRHILATITFCLLSNIAFAQSSGEGCTGDMNINELATCQAEEAALEGRIANYPPSPMKALCETRFGILPNELLTCLETQTEAAVQLLDEPEVFRDECQAEWSTDYELTLHCVERAIETAVLKKQLEELSPPPPPSLTRVMRHVQNLHGPYLVTKVNSDASLQVVGDGRYERVHFQALKMAMPKKAVKMLKRRLLNEVVYIEPSNNGRGYIYAFGLSGEWQGQELPLKQLNLTLIEQGLALAEDSDERYGHFYQNAETRAEMDNTGIWAGR